MTYYFITYTDLALHVRRMKLKWRFGGFGDGSAMRERREKGVAIVFP